MRRHSGVLQIVVVHRPVQEDWSFPKGKLEAGETLDVAALVEPIAGDNPAGEKYLPQAIQSKLDEDRKEIDAETAARLRIHVDSDARRKYTEAFDNFSASIKTVAFRNNGRYAGLPTNVPVDEAIFGTLMKSQVIA